MEPLALSDRSVLRALDLGAFPLHLFDSHCRCGGRRYVFDREFALPNGMDTVIRLNGTRLDFGEDPRAFEHRGAVCAVSAVYMGGYGFRNHLFVIEGAAFDRLFLQVPSHLAPGKNWSPFTFANGDLGFIHSMDPLVVLREKRRERGLIVLDALGGTGPGSEIGPGAFAAHRGGTCGILVDGQVFGIGHTTRHLPGTDSGFRDALGFDHLFHRPFGWVLDPETLAMRFFDITGPFDDAFSVVDPASLAALPDGGFEVVTTEVERHYLDVAGRGAIARYRFRLPPGFLDRARRQNLWVEIAAATFTARDGGRDGQTLRARLGGACHHVIYGPYLRLKPATYEVEFLFHVEPEPGAGGAQLTLDIAADAEPFPGACALDASAIAAAPGAPPPRMRFTHEAPDRAVEFRVHARGFSAGELVFRGVRLTEVDPAPG